MAKKQLVKLTHHCNREGCVGKIGDIIEVTSEQAKFLFARGGAELADESKAKVPAAKPATPTKPPEPPKPSAPAVALAKEHGADLSTVTATGNGGATITVDDVRTAIAEQDEDED